MRGARLHANGMRLILQLIENSLKRIPSKSASRFTALKHVGPFEFRATPRAREISSNPNCYISQSNRSLFANIIIPPRVCVL